LDSEEGGEPIGEAIIIIYAILKMCIEFEGFLQASI
jgi:hypothetical protein